MIAPRPLCWFAGACAQRACGTVVVSSALLEACFVMLGCGRVIAAFAPPPRRHAPPARAEPAVRRRFRGMRACGCDATLTTLLCCWWFGVCCAGFDAAHCCKGDTVQQNGSCSHRHQLVFTQGLRGEQASCQRTLSCSNQGSTAGCQHATPHRTACAHAAYTRPAAAHAAPAKQCTAQNRAQATCQLSARHDQKARTGAQTPTAVTCTKLLRVHARAHSLTAPKSSAQHA